MTLVERHKDAFVDAFAQAAALATTQERLARVQALLAGGPPGLARALVAALLVAATVLLLGGRLDIPAVAGALLIGAGAGVSWLWRPRCWPPRRSSV